MTIIPLSCRYCNAPMQKTRTSRPQGLASCRPCQKAGRDLKHGTEHAYAKRGCRCDECRACMAEKMREYNADVKARDGVTASAQFKRERRGVDPALQIDCFLCKIPLAYVRATPARYPLHKACKLVAPDWMRGQRDNPQQSKRKARRAAFQAKIDRAARGKRGKRVFTAGACDWCGDGFVGLGVTCSAKCSKRRAWDNAPSSGRAFKVSPTRRVRLYSRDGWACQICRLPVDNTVDYLDDLYPTLDHIVPQSHGVAPDHSDDNLRTAHRFCNSLLADGRYIDDAGVRAVALLRLAA